MSTAAARPRFELGFAAVFFAILAALFSWTPNSRLGSETLSPVDAPQRSEWLAVDPGWRAGNAAQEQVATDLHAEFALEREGRARGTPPAWDRFSGFGSPLTARPSNSTLSPVSWLHRVLPFDRALLVESLAKLFLAGFLLYGFLRALLLRPLACAFGAVSFVFSGTLLEHLAEPSSVVSLSLLGGLWVCESLARKVDRDAPRAPAALTRLAYPQHAALFAACVALGAAAGDLQAFAWMSVVLAGFACARAFGIHSRQRDDRASGVALVSILAQFTLLAGLAVCLSGAFLASSFEFARESWILRERLLHPVRALDGRSIIAAFFPALLGDPAHVSAGGIATFTGLTTVFCALLAPVVVRGRRALAFFAVAALVYVVLAYDVLGMRGLMHALAVFRLVSVESGLVVWHVAVAVCAAFLVQRASTRGPSRNWTAAFVVLCAALVYAFVVRAAASNLLLTSLIDGAPDVARSEFVERSARHLFSANAWFLLGAGLVAGTWILRSTRARTFLLAGCVAVVLATNAVPFERFRSVSPNALAFASTPALEEVRARTALHRPLFMGTTALPPRVAALHDIESWSDATGAALARVERLRRLWFVREANGYGVRWASYRGLRAFGIDRLVGDDDWVDVDTWTGFASKSDQAEYLTRPLVADANVEFDFVILEAAATSLRVCFETGGGPLLQNIELNVHDRATGERLTTRLLSPDFAHPNREPRVFVDVPLPRLDDWSSRRLRLVVGSNDASPDTAWSLVARRDWKHVMNAGLWRKEGVLESPLLVRHPSLHQFKARQDGRELPGSIVVDMTWRAEAFRRESPLAGRTCHEFVEAVPIHRTVSHAVAARGEEAAFLMSTSPAFDPARAVVIEGIDADSGSPASGTAEPVEVVSEDGDRVHLRTTRGRPGWLVTSRPWYPGWRASVNGVEKPLHRANYAFAAVALDAGAADVVLEYVPHAARAGTWVAWLAFAVMAAWFALSRGSRLSRAARSA